MDFVVAQSLVTDAVKYIGHESINTTTIVIKGLELGTRKQLYSHGLDITFISIAQSKQRAFSFCENCSLPDRLIFLVLLMNIGLMLLLLLRPIRFLRI